MSDEAKDGTKTTGPQRHFKFAVEINNPKNQNVLWPLSKEVLRGRWAKSNLTGVTMADAMTSMPDLPGQVIAVDTRDKSAAILDPLNDAKKHEQRLKKARKVHKAALKVDAGPAKDKVFRNLTPTKVKSWCYWVRRMLDNQQVVVVSGEVPTIKQIADMPGNILCEHHNSSHEAVRERQLNPDEYVAPEIEKDDLDVDEPDEPLD